MNKTEDRMENKKELTRLLIYLGFAFVLAWLVFFVFILTGHTWDYSSQNLQQLVGLGMLAPVIAHVLTRKITKEGFAITGRDSMMLGISFRDRKWVYFAMAVLLPWIYTELGNGITLLLCPDLFDAGYYKILGVEKGMVFIQPASAIVSGVFVSFAAFGEEGGWRGYMMPKLMKFMSPVKAMIAGGIIWGLWHAPLTCIGHNFGTDYPGFPYVGILLMCIYCTLVGIILTYVTEKSGSIWPAAILHAVNNAGPSILSVYMNFGKVSGAWGETMAPWTGRMVSAAIFAIICVAAYAAPGRAESKNLSFTSINLSMKQGAISVPYRPKSQGQGQKTGIRNPSHNRTLGADAGGSFMNRCPRRRVADRVEWYRRKVREGVDKR